MRRICIFAGSQGGSPSHVGSAQRLAEAIVRSGHGIVYGGGRTGLMGVIADAALSMGGDVHGVIPRSLVDRELAHDGLTSLSIATSMHDRKTTMHSLSDAFIAIPGGFGTLDELFETVTWLQLGLHEKPVGLLNVDGYWEHLVEWINRAVRDGFVNEESARNLIVDSDEGRMVARLTARYR